jgi:hypothetical protein
MKKIFIYVDQAENYLLFSFWLIVNTCFPLVRLNINKEHRNAMQPGFQQNISQKLCHEGAFVFN